MSSLLHFHMQSLNFLKKQIPGKDVHPLWMERWVPQLHLQKFSMTNGSLSAISA